MLARAALDQPADLLTRPAGFSGSAAFCYTLQAHGRVHVIGETINGGAAEKDNAISRPGDLGTVRAAGQLNITNSQVPVMSNITLPAVDTYGKALMSAISITCLAIGKRGP